MKLRKKSNKANSERTLLDTSKSRHGICTPLAFLRSKKSQGIGDFGDLAEFIPFCASLGFTIIQLLPLQDSGNDPSPYAAHSSCALHPIYIDLTDLPYAKQDQEILSASAKLSQEPFTPYINYAKTLKEKINILHNYYKKYGSIIEKTEEFKDFISSSFWLFEYITFKIAKNNNEGRDWTDWPFLLRDADQDTLFKMAQESQELYRFWEIVQFIAHLQLAAAKKQAKESSIFLMGDIPLFVSKDSHDVWMHRNLFDLTLCAGSPPDAFNSEGQNWGLPILKWDQHKKSDFSWWQRRLEATERYFDLFRIDHALGFFRFFCIPSEQKTGAHGFMIPTNKSLWGKQGKTLLSAILKLTKMLPIAEDLGDLPSVVPKVLKKLSIPGTKVIRWEQILNKESSIFIDPADYPQVSMTTTGTHDTCSLAEWWQNDPSAKQYAKQYKLKHTPKLSLNNRLFLLTQAHQSHSYFHINSLLEYLPLDPSLGATGFERINVPGTVNDHNWLLRMPCLLEELAQSTFLISECRKLTLYKQS